MPAQLRHDTLEFLHAARCPILIRGAQPCAQQMFSAEDVQRQVAVAPVVAVEKPTLLVTVQRIIGRIQVQPNLSRRLAIRLHEYLHQHVVEPIRVGRDSLVSTLRRLGRLTQLQPIQRARARQRMTSVTLTHPMRTHNVHLAHQHRHHAV